MSGFLHQLASRSLGLAPQIKSRAALPYAAPTADFSMTEAASSETPPASAGIERPGYAPSQNIRRSEQATNNALPAPIVAEIPARATPVDTQTSPQNTSQPPRTTGQQSPLDAPLDIAPNWQAPPPAVIATRPVTAELNPVPQHGKPASENRHPVENTQPAFPDLESLITRLLGDKQNHPEKSPEVAAPPTVVTTRQAKQRPAEISTIRPQAVRERQIPAREADSAPEVHITIGCLEVNPPSRPAPAAQPQRPRGPAPLSLSDYLARRNGGRS